LFSSHCYTRPEEDKEESEWSTSASTLLLDWKHFMTLSITSLSPTYHQFELDHGQKLIPAPPQGRRPAHKVRCHWVACTSNFWVSKQMPASPIGKGRRSDRPWGDGLGTLLPTLRLQQPTILQKSKAKWRCPCQLIPKASSLHPLFLRLPLLPPSLPSHPQYLWWRTPPWRFFRKRERRWIKNRSPAIDPAPHPGIAQRKWNIPLWWMRPVSDLGAAVGRRGAIAGPVWYYKLGRIVSIGVAWTRNST
jgi:hypothetical protein